jgi:hypothetical protein
MGDNKLDVTSTAVEKSIDLVKGFLEKLVGATIEETGLIWADNVKLIRFKNQIKILTKAQKIVEESGINPKQISLKTLVPLLEYSSLEDDETLQERWTNLIVNFVDSSKNFESSIFPSILNQISTNELLAIEEIYQLGMKKEFPAKPGYNKFIYKRDTIKLSPVEYQNLLRLGLVGQNYNYQTIANSGVTQYQSNYLTPIAIEFIECCLPANATL